MLRRTFAVALGLGLSLSPSLFTGIANAQTPPPTAELPATERAERLKERDRLWTEAQKLRSDGKLAEAIATGRKMLAIERDVLAADHEDLLISLNWLANLAEQAEDWQAAEPLRAEALVWLTKHRGKEYWQTVDARLALQNVRKLKSLTALQRGELQQAAVLYQRYAELDAAGRYGEAIPLLKEQLNIRGRLLGKQHPLYATSLNNLAGLYQSMGDYARAEPLYVEARAIKKEVLGEKHHDYATSLNNLAELYRSMGDYARAEPLFVEARAIDKVVLGEKHPDYATDLNNLALLYERMGDYARAEPLYVEARAIDKAVLGEKHPDYATDLNNLALLYNSMGDYARAEPLYVEARAIRKEILGERHPDYATSLNNLAGLYYRMGDHARAEPLYVEARAIKKEALGEKHPSYATSLNNLAFLYTAINRSAEAEPLYRQALAISRGSLEASAAVQSERQQLAMEQGLRHQLDTYVSLGLQSEEFARNIFSEVLVWKGSTLVRQRGMRLAGEDPAVAGLFAQLQRTATQLASLSRAVPPTEDQQAAWRERLTRLTHDKERFEAQLSTKSAAFRQATKEVSLDELLAALPTDAVLVDYLEFTRSTPPKEKGKPTTYRSELVAFVVRHAEKPEDQVAMISLGPVEPMASAIDRWRTTFGVGDDAAAAGAELRKLVLEPVLAALNEEPGTDSSSALPLTPGPSPTRGEGSQTALSPLTTHHPPRTLLVSTDGVLGRIPFAALPGVKPDTYLIEDHRLAMIPVPQLLPALIGREGTRELDRELLLVGDVDYDAAPGTTESVAPKKRKPRRPGEPTRSPTDGKLFDPLANTAGEIAALEKLFGRVFDVDADDLSSLTRAEADEARFRELAPRYRHLHLATHGFFAGSEFASAERSRSGDARGDRAMLADRESTVVGHNPGLLSGLALAGANREPTADSDDGILTSQEIGVMNLSGVETVVLSACDTGLGETAGGEGLLGVQRAFQVAGARTTVASFWKVDDLVTRLLMERFYRNLWEGEMSRLDALREAQLYVLNHPEAIRGSDPQPADPKLRTAPRLWAAFALSGDWR